MNSAMLASMDQFSIYGNGVVLPVSEALFGEIGKMGGSTLDNILQSGGIMEKSLVPAGSLTGNALEGADAPGSPFPAANPKGHETASKFVGDTQVSNASITKQTNLPTTISATNTQQGQR
jgi:hypothetical protein